MALCMISEYQLLVQHQTLHSYKTKMQTREDPPGCIYCSFKFTVSSRHCKNSHALLHKVLHQNHRLYIL